MQAIVLSITDKQQAYAETVASQLRAAGFRADADLRNEKIGFKIREAEKAKIPFMLVVGDREMQGSTVSVRGRSKTDLGSMPVPAVMELLRKDTTQAVSTL